MPLVRIDLPDTTSSTEAAAVSKAVHSALVEVFNVPADDLFQVVARRAAGEIVCAPQYLGVQHTDKVVFVQVACAPGRTVGQKEALYARIASGIARAMPSSSFDCGPQSCSTSSKPTSISCRRALRARTPTWVTHATCGA